MIRVPTSMPDFRGAAIWPASIRIRGFAAHRQHGQSAIEYLIAVALLCVVLMMGQDSPLDQLMRAFGDRYGGFTHAISRP